MKANQTKGEKIMRKINIVKDNKIQTISYNEKSDFILDLKFILNFPLHEIYRFKLADIIWDLNVGTAYSCFGYKFLTLSKRKVS